MAMWRTWGAVVGVLLTASAGRGQNHLVAEGPKPGECFRIEIETTVNGNLKVTRNDKPTVIPLAVKNHHILLEKILSEDKNGVRKVARHYVTAESAGTIGGDKTERALSTHRRLMVAQRTADSLLCYSPAGPMTRPELEVAAEHFDTLQLTGILPGKQAAVGDSWKLSNVTAQALCLFEGLIAHELTGKLTEVRDGHALIAIEGKASGIEAGALVNLTITATARFDLLKDRLVSLEWKQKDTRDQGPASPASEVETTTTLKRTLLDEEPKELSTTALVSVPSEDDPPALLKQLAHRDPQGRYSFLYSREWHIVGQTETHLVLRLLDRGDFVAQATVTPYLKAEPGKHISSDEFRMVVSESPGWQMDELVDAAEVPTDDGRWSYRVTARGSMDGVPVVQSFYVLAAPSGEQVVVTFTMKPSHAAKIGTRDVALVNAIMFPKK